MSTSKWFRYLKRRGLSIVLVAVLMLTLIPPTLSWAEGDAAPVEFEGINMPDRNIFADDNGNPGDELSQEGSLISMDDKLWLRFKWSNDETLGELALETGKKYRLCTLPSQISTTGINGTPICADDDQQFAMLHVGDAELDGKKPVYIEFTRLELCGANVYINCSFAKDASADGDNDFITIDLPGSKSYEITVKDFLPDGPKLEKTATSFDHKGLVTWTITYTPAEDGYAGNPHIPNPMPKVVWLKDTLPKGMLYVENSAKVDGSSVAVTVDPMNTDPSQTLTYKIPDSDAPVTLTYQTRLTDAECAKLWIDGKSSGSYTNTVQGLDETKKPIDGLSAQDTASFDGSWAKNHAALSKTGNYSKDSSREATWTVTVNTLSRNFEYLQVVDTMAKGLTFVSDSLKLKDSETNAETSIPSGLYEITPNADGTSTLTLDLYKEHIQKLAPDSKGRYTITYKTVVSIDYFLQTKDADNKVIMGEDEVKNKAELKWGWYNDGKGEGPGAGSLLPPSIKKDPIKPQGLSSGLIVKTELGYDPATHIITWAVTLNTSQLNIASLHFEDVLQQNKVNNGYIYVRAENGSFEEFRDEQGNICRTRLPYEDPDELIDSLKRKKDGSINKETEELLKSIDITDVKFIKASDGVDRNIGFSCDLKNLGTKPLTIYIRTEVVDTSFWAANRPEGNTYRVQNYAGMSEVKIKQSDGSTMPIQGRSSTASQFISSKMLKKESGDYDPSTGRMEYKLTINENKTDGLGTVTVVDTLPAGMTYETGSTQIDGVPVEDDGIVEVDEAKNTITWTLSKDDVKTSVNGGTVDLTFVAKLDVDGAVNDEGENPFLTQDVVELKNTATLKSEAYDEFIKEVTAEAKLANKVLDKSAVQDTDSNKVTYTVKLNPYGVGLHDEEDAQLYLEDTLPAGLVLDLESVKLYKATTSSIYDDTRKIYTTEMTKGDPVDLAGKIEYETIENGTKNRLRVPVDDKQPYIVTYDAYIVQSNTDLVNEAALTGAVLPEGSSIGNDSATCRIAAFGSAYIKVPDSNWELRITKTDKNSGNAIIFDEEHTGAPARFGLYKTKNESSKLLEGTCAPDTGICTFSQPKSVLGDVTTLYIRELEAPTGYVRDKQWYELTSDQLESLKAGGEVELSISNEPIDEDTPEPDSETGAIKVIKSYVGGTPAVQAVFTLYKDEECIQLVEELPLDSDGTGVFENLTPEAAYYLKETSTPEGFIPDTQVKKVFASSTADDPMEVRVVNEYANEQPHAALQIMKVSASDNSVVLPGAKFALYSDPERNHEVGSGITDEDGLLLFKNLYPNTKYWLLETEAPEGYVRSENAIEVTTGASNSEEYPAELQVSNAVKPSEPVEPVVPSQLVEPVTVDPISVILEAKKVLDGKNLKDGEFIFALKSSTDGILQWAQNNAQGNILFQPIIYKQAGAYTYTIFEVQGKEKDVTYDTAVHSVTVSVTESSGRLAVSVSYDGGNTPPVFTNSFIGEPDEPEDDEDDVEDIPDEPEEPAQPVVSDEADPLNNLNDPNTPTAFRDPDAQSNDPRIAQTGQNWVLFILLTAAGLILFITGLVCSRRSKRN